MKLKAIIIFVLNICSTVLLQDDLEEPSKDKVAAGKECSTLQGVNTKFMVGLTNKMGELFCSGSLINEEWVLTSAHCMDSLLIYVVHESKISRCYLKERYLNRICLIPVIELIVHPFYDKDSISNDIGVLRLEKPLKKNKEIDFIRLPNTKDVVNSLNATIMGWGSSESNTISSVLRCAEIEIMDALSCKEILDSVKPEIQICTKPEYNKDACILDSGGPLMHGNVQIGIVPKGISCADDKPAVYTRVDRYRGFIEHLQRSDSTTIRLHYCTILILGIFYCICN